MILNQNPEQVARDHIDKQLTACGWIIQSKTRINLHEGVGVAVREYQTDVGPADYVLFVEGKPVGVIEAKREDEGFRLTVHEDQAEEYASAKLKYLNNDPLPFVYVSTGKVTSFTDFCDPKPRGRAVFCFHRPETLRGWLKKPKSLRASLLDLTILPTEGLRDCQINAITNLEQSFRNNKPRSLIQMATGSGKTFTAITFIYRLLKYTQTKKILFLVDTKNLGEQAEQEFMSFLPNDDNRKFTELYGVHRLKSKHIPDDNQVYISTIQRLYAVLKGQDLEESAEEENPNEKWQPREVPPVEYNEKLPIEYFDFIVIDECHRSIYNLWMQVLDYFDAFQVGLTATPDARTIAYFRQNMVSEYSHEMAVADGVNVGYDVYLIETKVTRQGATLWKGEYVEHRERLSRKKRLELQDEDENYSSQQLDKDIVNPNQIRKVIATFKEHLPVMFPDRYDKKGEFEVPKTLIFAKTDSHADDIIQTVREVFNEENRFCKKVTYKASEDPKSVLAQFRNDYHPRIAVTVDMIATGTDVKPLECLLFMRDVKSRNYFEQMKGRGTRVINFDDLKKVSPSARLTKDHFVIVDAIGVTRSLKTDSRPLEKKPGIALKDLLGAVAVGARDEDLFTSLANRLTRLDKQITEKEKNLFAEKAGGLTLAQVVKNLLNAFNPDTVEAIEQQVRVEQAGEAPAVTEAAINQQLDQLRNEAARVFTGELNEYIENVRKAHEQKIDLLNPDEVLNVGWEKDNAAKAQETIMSFEKWIEGHRDEIVALQLFYDQPYRRRELTFAMVKDLVETLLADKPTLAPLRVWQAYSQLESVSGQPKNELVALVALIRRVAGIDDVLTPYDRTVDRNFQQWLFRKQAGTLKFTKEQMDWLYMLRDQITTSVHVDTDDLDYTPFDAKGGRGRMWQLFGEDMEMIINELNEASAA
ncbi:DEAD/DEAH box helicase family protein [Telluribacter sp.]|jgi:type I restriction enzyme R subunit|uniref:type I restriction endonuclease subunit R n=1 Tax=Telluribacter sp. TaxID=1978767 RepID=UPI002E12BE24|nr:DEAD/DEAH box helicase family protein [Telluribacter sp.]